MVRVKICGVPNAADARACCSAGANLLGFNFYEKSPRYITAAEGEKIRAELPAEVEAVGVFVNSKAADVVELCRSLHLNAAQLHGDESPEIVSEVARSITVFKAFRVGPVGNHGANFHRQVCIDHGLQVAATAGNENDDGFHLPSLSGTMKSILIVPHCPPPALERARVRENRR